ncbi:MAG: histidine phosphatase family protein [Armatimonadota bacterium]
MSQLLIIRHGETAWNRERVFRGRTDVPLSERGVAQAGLLAGELKEARIEAIHSSPLSRAIRTAEPLASLLHLDVVADQRLTDMSFGDWEGRPEAEVKQAEPDALGAWHERPHEFRPPGGESLSEVATRAWDAVDEIAREHPSGRVALFSHRVVCKVIVLTALGAGLDAFWHLRLDTASISVIERAGRSWTATLVNDTHHLHSLPYAAAVDF